ncbi:expressed unknown protein [Seminavis robusta]|uniref:Nucleotide-diphospho-sugar transferase domain-containing protein n=1 Tax=Seminavis robusta TaxID=568900 RepID=A0A9N8EUC9_9STRA|nr:expressed unknown protein [Seminavis robusta]|eukprot:Sro1903_g304530.1 n/a (746) ;mRNA; r:14680-16917
MVTSQHPNTGTGSNSSNGSSRNKGVGHDKKAFYGLLLLLGLAMVVIFMQQTNLRNLQQNYQNHHHESTSHNTSDASSSALQRSVQNDTSSGKIVKKKKLPDWRIAMDCSIWDFHCVTTRQKSGVYEAYPFPYTRKYDHEHLFKWEQMDKVPVEWQQELADINTTLSFPPPRTVEYTYKEQVSESELQKCLQSAQDLSWKEQIRSLIQGPNKQLDASKNDLNLLAFTISDYKYAKDMMHDFFQMNDNIVGLPGALFMVAIDHETLEMACRYNYPVVAWTSAVPRKTIDTEREDLKHSVANTKFEVSSALVEMDQDFFFYEMDVWFLQSPMPILALFHDDILFSSHQYCPKCVNIGVYLVHANAATKEYFKVAIQLAQECPDTHDQFVMAQILHMVNMGEKFGYSNQWKPAPPDYIPKFEHPVKHGFFSSHEIAAAERPYTSQMAIAIHPLRDAPLKSPHGKKILAKEMGAWYGFEGPPGALQAGTAAGYYHRQGRARRYLMMDGHILNGYSNVINWEFDGNEAGIFKHYANLFWTVAALVALARRTGRIWILPPVGEERGIHFLWSLLDLESVEELGVDYRETTFFNNQKSWIRPHDTPFDTVARSALGSFDKDQTMFAQYNDVHDDPVTRAWKFGTDQVDSIDAWWALHTTIPQVDGAEALLVNTHFLNLFYHRRIEKRLRNGLQNMSPHPSAGRGRAEYDIAGVFSKLRWCPKGKDYFGNIVGAFQASDDCYGRGETIDWVGRL